jgi:hypothetical protein
LARKSLFTPKSHPGQTESPRVTALSIIYAWPKSWSGSLTIPGRRIAEEIVGVSRQHVLRRVMTPALVVDKEIKLEGQVSSVEEINKMIARL